MTRALGSTATPRKLRTVHKPPSKPRISVEALGPLIVDRTELQSPIKLEMEVPEVALKITHRYIYLDTLLTLLAFWRSARITKRVVAHQYLLRNCLQLQVKLHLKRHIHKFTYRKNQQSLFKNPK